MPATRSLAPTENDTKVTAPPITPDATEADAARSTLVCTDTAPPGEAAPIVTPVSVTVTAVLAASAAPPTVMTMEVVPGAPGARVAPLVDRVALGAAVAAKKPDG